MKRSEMLSLIREEAAAHTAFNLAKEGRQLEAARVRWIAASLAMEAAPWMGNQERAYQIAAKFVGYPKPKRNVLRPPSERAIRHSIAILRKAAA